MDDDNRKEDLDPHGLSAPDVSPHEGAHGARPQHYLFAHHLLRQAVHVDPKGFLALLMGENAQGFLDALWDEAGKDQPLDALVDRDGLHVDAHKDGDTYEVMVTLPPPEITGECHLVSVVVRFGKKRFLRRQTYDIAFRTLEKGAWLSGNQRTVIGGWTDDGQHLTFGDGPRFVTAESFRSALQELVV